MTLDDVPVVTASMAASSPVVPTASVVATAVSNSSAPPRNAAVPAGTMGKTVTTTYSDGRQVTTTEYLQPGASSSMGARPLALAAPSPAASQYHPPRPDLGSRPVSVRCPYCTSTVRTRTKHNSGDCTLISVIVLLLFFWPLFWVPFIFPDCQDVEHKCSNCGRLVGKSKAQCCS
mmetsp:Transcript_18192/g.32948  ORF Transcript_18192/g.32948 Transcript_18192/m.32948 type:complete len:175 (-) Transcript_18192:373-897(-)